MQLFLDHNRVQWESLTSPSAPIALPFNAGRRTGYSSPNPTLFRATPPSEKIDLASWINQKIAAGVIDLTQINTDNFANANLTFTGARSHNANTNSLAITALTTLSFTQNNATTFTNTTGGGGTTNFSTDDGSNNAAGDLIHQFQFNARRSGSSSTISRIQAYYEGDGTTRNGRLDFLVAEVSGAGNPNFRLVAIGNEKYAILGDGLSSYTTSDYDATTMISAGNIGVPVLGVDNYSKESIFLIKEDGTLNAGKYGAGNKEAADLSKTDSGYRLGVATDGTIIEVSGGGYVTTDTTQTISAAKTFSGAFTLSNASVTASAIPTYADNAAAVTGGLAVGRIYKTATGELRIVV